MWSVLLFVFLAGGFDPSSLDGFREDYMRGVQAFRDGDMQTFYEATASAHKQNPSHVGVQFNFAVANAQTGRLAEGIALLHDLGKKGLVMPLDSQWLEPLAKAEALAAEWQAVEALFAANSKPVLKAEAAYTLPRKDFYAEGIAIDPRTKALYVGSVHHREIVRFDKEGVATTFVESGRDGLMSVLGIAVDPIKRLLWVCSSGFKQSKDLDAGKVDTAELLAFQLETGALAQRISAPKAGEGKGNNLNDIVRHRDGTLYLSDAVSGAIYRLPLGGSQLEMVLPHGTFRSPQGLALNANGSALFIADYSHGLFQLNLKTQDLIHVKVPENVVLAGIDGLLAYGDDLIAIQNGVRPHRVLRIQLEDRGSVVKKVSVLEQNHPKFDEPTLGVVVDKRLLFVGASQWPHYDREGKPLAVEALRQPEILALEL